MSALLNFKSFLVIVLLFICTSTFLRKQRPSMFQNRAQASGMMHKMLYKGSVIGTRLSPYVSVSCFLMAFAVLFF